MPADIASFAMLGTKMRGVWGATSPAFRQDASTSASPFGPGDLNPAVSFRFSARLHFWIVHRFNQSVFLHQSRPLADPVSIFAPAVRI
jgi:hypothetical protein